MKIMMIEPLGDGGIAHYTFNLLQALSANGVDSILFTSKAYELRNEKYSFKLFPEMFHLAFSLIKIFPWLGTEQPLPSIIRRVLKGSEYPISSVKALFLIKKHRIQGVHIQSISYVDIIPIFLIKMLRIPVVCTVHNVMPWHRQLKFYQRFLFRTMYKLCNQIIIHSHEGKKRITELYAIDHLKISVVPHGDYKFFLPEEIITKNEAKQKLNISEDRKTILFFGAIRPNKGLDHLLNALSIVRIEIPKVLLLIVGELSEDYSKYQKIIQKNNLRNSLLEKLEYIPNDRIADFFFAADVIALPYTEVTQSGVLQIAYAFGKPIVATNVGGFSEVIEDGKSGYLVDAKDDASLASRLIDILSDEKKIKLMGEHARYLSDTRFSWDAIARKTHDIYQLI